MPDDPKPGDGTPKPGDGISDPKPGDGANPKPGDGKPNPEPKGDQPPARVVPESYTLTAPEGGPFDEADIAGFAERAKLLGLTQAEAEKMVTAEATHLTKQAEAWAAETKAAYGAEFEAASADVAKGRDALLPKGEEFSDFIIGLLDRTGLGNHKAVYAMFRRVGRLASEDGGIGGGGGRDEEVKSDADVFFKS